MGFIAAAHFVIGAVLCVTIAFGLAMRGVPLEPIARDDKSAVGVLLVDTSDGVILYPARSGWGWTVAESERCRAMSHSVQSIKFEYVTRGTPSQTYWSGEGRDVARIATPADRRHFPEQTQVNRLEFQFGMPMRAFWGAADETNHGCFGGFELSQIRCIRDVPTSDVYAYFVDPGRPRLTWRIPTGVMYDAAAANSAILGAGSWSLASLVGLAVRRVRAWRGRCPACSYNMTGLGPDAVCPECGAASATSTR